MINWDYNRTWYHGSPYELTTLRATSAITQDKHLATVFSHKPTLISISEDGKIKHNGTIPGFLYCISESIRAEDVVPHPHSAMEDGQEWLTNRELSVTLIGPTRIVEDEHLTEKELAMLKRWLKEKGNE